MQIRKLASLIWRSFLSWLMFITGAAKPNVVVLIARIVIQIERKRAGVGCIIPITATEEHPLC